MPEDTETYDPETETLTIGSANFSPVPPEVATYAVGGRGVIHSWVGYRRKEPIGTYQSPLDKINSESWPREWTRDFLELLTVLRKLVEMEDQQDEVLEQILEDELFTVEELVGLGVQFPASRTDMKPRYPVADDEGLFGNLD